jgi:thiamine biosynthesis lipoprotein
LSVAVRREEHVMGMPVAVEIRDPDAGAEAVARAFAWLRWVDATFTTYDPASEIARLGRGELALRDAHPLVRAVLGRCEALRRRTAGYFDVRAVPGATLDPSGLVKGWAVQRAGRLLVAAGARHVCVDAGGDLFLRGGSAPGVPWRVGIRHPRERGRLAAVLAVTDGAVATSGAYERGAHILDPHTGCPPAGVESVTVVGPALATADAYATAAFAMGRDGPTWTARLAPYEAMTVLDGDRVLSTPGFLRHVAGPSLAASVGA